MATSQEDPQAVAEQRSQEVIDSATLHATTIEEARRKQLEAAITANREETLHIFTEALQHVLSGGEEGTKLLLIQKIPLLCADILIIKNNIKWIMWLVMGTTAVIGTSIIGGVIMKLNGG